MKIRIDYDLAAVPDRLKAWGHPYADEWDLESLRYCLVARFIHTDPATDEDRVVGYMWFHWLNVWARQLEMHIAVDPEFHGRWYTRRTRNDYISLARLCDAHYIIARDNASPKQMSLLSRGGYVYNPDAQWWALAIPENHR